MDKNIYDVDKKSESSFGTCCPLIFFNKGREVIPKTKRYFFGIEQFIKQLKKEGKLNFIVLDKSTHKDMVTDEVGVPNDVLVCLRTHHKCFSLIK